MENCCLYENSSFALERHLKREEAIYPQKQLGLIRDEAVYPRSSVVTVKSAEQWMREGLKVKEGEQPLKMVKSRAVTINRRRVHELAKSEGREEDTLQGLYARWQTVKSIPPPVVDVSSREGETRCTFCSSTNVSALGNRSEKRIWQLGPFCAAHAAGRWCSSTLCVPIKSGQENFC